MKKHKKKIGILLLAVLIMAITASGCGLIDQFSSKFKNSFLGNGGKLTVYDDYGNNTLTLKNVSVSIGLFENAANKDSESNGFKSEVLDLQVDGKQMLHVGSTMIFAEKGLNAIQDYDYDYLKKVTGEQKATFIPLERSVNNFQNLIGKSRVVVVKSQMGIVVGIYEGDSVAVSVPENLPKTTLVTIDGKALYIHRADYEIIDASLLKQ